MTNNFQDMSQKIYQYKICLFKVFKRTVKTNSNSNLKRNQGQR